MSKRLDPFESPKRRLKRAKGHIDRLEKRIRSFIKKEPGERIADTDSKGVTTHALKFTRKFPDSWGDTAVEAIEGMRAALDQIGYAAAVLGGANEPKNAYFPVADTVSDLDGVVKGRCKDIPPEISALFRSFNAHERGNYGLWALNKLCNANKHRLLVPVGLLTGGMQLHKGFGRGFEVFPPTWNRDKRQIEFARVQPGGDFKYDANITFYIAFDDFNGVKAGPAVGILNHVAGEVRKVLNATEAECRKIGIL